MSWPVLGRRVKAAVAIVAIVVTVAGIVGAVASKDLAWVVIALQLDLIVMAVVLARSSWNESRMRNPEGAGAAAMPTMTYAPGEPLDLLRRDLQRDLSGMFGLHQLITVPGAVPAPGGWAATPETLLALVARVLTAPRIGTVVECGSGTSTIWTALALRQRGQGRLISLEHEAEFGQKTQATLDALGLADLVELRISSLVENTDPSGSGPWYDPATLSGIDDISILFVDGPPAYLGERIRGRAVPLLADRFEPDVRVILDDVDREDERRIIEAWTTEEWAGVRLEQLSSTDRAAILGRVDRPDAG